MDHHDHGANHRSSLAFGREPTSLRAYLQLQPWKILRRQSPLAGVRYLLPFPCPNLFLLLLIVLIQVGVMGEPSSTPKRGEQPVAATQTRMLSPFCGEANNRRPGVAGLPSFSTGFLERMFPALGQVKL